MYSLFLGKRLDLLVFEFNNFFFKINVFVSKHLILHLGRCVSSWGRLKYYQLFEFSTLHFWEMYFSLLGRDSSCWLSSFSTLCLGGQIFSWGRTALLTSCFSNVSSFKASPDIGVGFSNMYLGGYFSVFGKQLDLLGIKFFNFTFWECILSFWERDSIYWFPSFLTFCLGGQIILLGENQLY